jgi:hypothetical protein
MFKQGYVAGFIDCVRIAKALDPFSYIATQFPAPPKAKPLVWVRTIDELYAKDEHKNRTLAQILIIAGTKLQKDLGEEPFKPNDQRLEALRDAIDRQRRALLQARKTVEAAQDELKKNGETDKPAGAEDKSSAAEPGKNGAAAKPDETTKGGEPSNDAKQGQHDAETPKPDSSGTSKTMPEGSHGMMPPGGSHEMMPEGSHPDMPLKHPQTDSAHPDDEKD